jgi:hypothetical protein
MSKPVAWFEQDPDMKSVWYQADKNAPNAIPLYTHPVKELTDEEILQFQDKVPYTLGSDLIEFARAILRKAQEK